MAREKMESGNFMLRRANQFCALTIESARCDPLSASRRIVVRRSNDRRNHGLRPDGGFFFQLHPFQIPAFQHFSSAAFCFPHSSLQLLRSQPQACPSHSSRETPACLSSRIRKPTPISPSCSLGMMTVKSPRFIWGCLPPGERSFKAKFMHALNELAPGNRIQFRHS